MSLFDAMLFNQGPFGGPAVSAGCHPVSGLVYAAYRKAGVTLGPGRTPSPAQFQDAIDELNRLVASWEIDRLNIYSIQIETFTLTGKKAYTIGYGTIGAADFTAPRPVLIEHANVVRGIPVLRYPLALITDQLWSMIRFQDIPNTIPQALYNDRAYPVSTLYIWGQPTAGDQLEIYVWTPLGTFASVGDCVQLPPGYEDAIVLNLAVRLAPHFQLPVNPDVRMDAQKSLMRIESINAPQPMANLSGMGCGSGFDIYSGY